MVNHNLIKTDVLCVVIWGSVSGWMKAGTDVG